MQAARKYQISQLHNKILISILNTHSVRVVFFPSPVTMNLALKSSGGSRAPDNSDQTTTIRSPVYPIPDLFSWPRRTNTTGRQSIACTQSLETEYIQFNLVPSTALGYYTSIYDFHLPIPVFIRLSFILF